MDYFLSYQYTDGSLRSVSGWNFTDWAWGWGYWSRRRSCRFGRGPQARSLRTLREKLIKIGAKLVRHSWYVVLQMAEVAVTKAPLAEILDRIARLRANPERAG